MTKIRGFPQQLYLTKIDLDTIYYLITRCVANYLLLLPFLSASISINHSDLCQNFPLHSSSSLNTLSLCLSSQLPQALPGNPPSKVSRGADRPDKRVGDLQIFTLTPLL